MCQGGKKKRERVSCEFLGQADAPADLLVKGSPAMEIISSDQWFGKNTMQKVKDFLYLSSLHSLAASMFAGDSSLGELSMESTDSRIDSTVCTGSHRSPDNSYLHNT